MNGNVQADLAAMPVGNIIAIGAVVLAIMGMGAFIIRFLKIKSIGPVKLLDQYNKMASCQHFMDDEIHDIDDQLRGDLHEFVETAELHLMNVFRSFINFGMLQEALTARICLIFTASIIRNHYTKELMPEKVKCYRDKIISQIEDRYRDSYSRTVNGGASMPPWEEVGERMIGIVDEWLKKVKDAVKSACGDKIEVYNRYALRFKDDEYRLGIVNECIAKNQKYIAQI